MQLVIAFFDGASVELEGAVPALDVFYASVGQKRKENPFFETFQAAQEQEAESLLLESPHKVNGQIGHVTKAATNGVSRKKLSGFVENSDKISFNFLWDNRRQRNKEPEAKCEMYDPKGGATGAENFLQRYIRALEETESDISQGSVSLLHPLVKLMGHIVVQCCADVSKHETKHQGDSAHNSVISFV